MIDVRKNGFTNGNPRALCRSLDMTNARRPELVFHLRHKPVAECPYQSGRLAASSLVFFGNEVELIT